MAKKRVRGSRGKSKTETAVKPQKNGSGNGGFKLKYDFKGLEIGQSLFVPNADAMTGKETILKNVKILSREYAGRHHGFKFEVKRTKDGQVQCARLA